MRYGENKTTLMHKTFTQENLLSYLYGEMNSEERQDLRSIVLEDDKLQAELLALREAKECLDKGRLSPSEYAVNNILSYAKALSVKPSKYLQSIAIVLN